MALHRDYQGKLKINSETQRIKSKNKTIWMTKMNDSLQVRSLQWNTKYF